MKAICRRTRVGGAHPDGQSCLNLAAARRRHIAASKWATRKSIKKSINMKRLYQEQKSTKGAVA